MTDKITIYCENCGKKILEEKASSYYKNNNYLIVCNKCYDTLKEINNDR